MKSILVAMLLPILATSACQHGRTSEKSESAAEGIPELRAKRDLYVKLSKGQRDAASGFIYVDNCDGLLFNALYAAVLSDADRAGIVLRDAEASPGQWLRRPVARGNCYPGGAASTISKDMLLGVIFYAWRTKDRTLLEDMEAYGRAHDWVMGEPFPSKASRVLMTPSLVGMLYQAIYKLGGKNHPSRRLPDIYPAGMKDYEAHLQVVSILLHAEIDDKQGLTSTMIERLKEHAEAEPENPFFAAAYAKHTGDYAAAVRMLLDTKHWPDSALPTSANHCSEWLIQREKKGADSAWNPCPAQSVQWSGGDFIFTASLVLP